MMSIMPASQYISRGNDTPIQDILLWAFIILEIAVHVSLSANAISRHFTCILVCIIHGHTVLQIDQVSNQAPSEQDRVHVPWVAQGYA